jgi:hypothetical protein
MPNTANPSAENIASHAHDVEQGTVVVRVTLAVPTPLAWVTVSCKGMTNALPSAESVAVNLTRVQAVRPVLETAVSAP